MRRCERHGAEPSHALLDALRGRPTARPQRLAVGIADNMPKLVAWRILEPALRGPDAVHLVCTEDKPERLLADLAIHEHDLVLADAPANSLSPVRAFSHLLGESAVSIFAAPKEAAGSARGFLALSTRRDSSSPSRARRCAGRSRTGSTRKASAR